MIKVKNLSKNFNINEENHVILDQIKLHVEKKDRFGIVGETGSGKSTLLRLMNGFIQPDGGKVYLFDQELNHNSRDKLVKETSMVFQHFNLLSNLNLIDNVLLPARLRKLDKKKSLERARELLDFVGLSQHEKSYVSSLSGGEKQRVAIARALISQPKIIFCDEPTSALDEKMSYEILKLLKNINEELGTTLVIVSHNISVIRTFCNKAAIIENGKISSVLVPAKEELLPISYKEALTGA